MIEERRVLILGSDPKLPDFISGLGCIVESAAGRSEAIARLTEKSYDLVLTDLATPGDEDLDLVRRIREIRPDAKVVVLSAGGGSDAVVASIRAHAFSYFSAPYEPDALREMVAQALSVTPWDDGIEILSARPNWMTLSLRCRRFTGDRLLQFFREFRADLPSEERENIAMAFREMLLNAIEHGGGFDPEKKVQVSYLRTERVILYHIRDPGPGFSADALPHAAGSNPPDDPVRHIRYRTEQGLRAGGFGMLLTRKLVDELLYNETGNEVILIKYI